jgi:hypothetical protein
MLKESGIATLRHGTRLIIAQHRIKLAAAHTSSFKIYFMKQNIIGKSLFIVATVALSCISFGSYAGEKGCITTPGKTVGYCAKNTEGSYSCSVNNGYQLDCSSSN